MGIEIKEKDLRLIERLGKSLKKMKIREREDKMRRLEEKRKEELRLRKELRINKVIGMMR